MLIESKVTADFQPGQVAAYLGEVAMARTQLGTSRAATVLVAPEGRIASLADASAFDAGMKQMMEDLTQEPPQPFDIARQGRVFSSKLQYVEFKVPNSRFSSRRVPLPPELINVADQRLKDRITSGVKPPTDAFGPFNIAIEQPDGETKKQSVGERWLTRERERIEQAYTFELKGFGRVILRAEQVKFETEVERFRRNLDSYRVAVNESLEKEKLRFAKVMAAEFLPRWKQRPPE